VSPNSGHMGRRHLFPLGAGLALLQLLPEAPTSSASLFSFWWNTVPAIQLDLLDRLSVSSVFPKKRQSEVLRSLYLKTV